MNDTNAKQWSTQQEAIFNWFKTGSGNLVVRARAGTGKTTTILSAIQYAPESRILLAAFNKKIAEELKTKLRNPSAEAKTLHSVGFGLVLRNWSGTKLDSTRGQRIAREVAGQSTPDPIVRLVSLLASKAKGMLPRTPEEMTAIARQFDLTPDEEWVEDGWTEQSVVMLAFDALKRALKRDGTIDFDDMVYLPVANNWVRPTYNMVVVDEAQDMNVAQLRLATGVCYKTGRIAVVGDDRQAIYGFRGADSASIDRLKTSLSATELGLTTTYRCPKSVVEYAAKLVPDYVAAPTAPQGEIKELDYAKLAEEVKPGDFVLSRKNAPLVRTCLSILRTGKRAKIEGRDIGAVLIGLVKKIARTHKTMPALLKGVSEWADRKSAAIAMASNDEDATESKVQEVQDTAETIRVLGEDLTSVAELVARIENLFGDDVNAANVVLSSVHRAKGRETEVVYVLRDTLYPGRGGKASKEEANIEYVAVTRAKTTLVWVDGI
jgi:superfamily I DNA/RNA helicase